MQELSFYTPIYPKKSGSVRNNGLALREGHVCLAVSILRPTSSFKVTG